MTEVTRSRIKELIDAPGPVDRVLVKGWVRTRRDGKAFSFLEINDGSCLENIQAVVDADVPGYADIHRLTTGASLELIGRLAASPGRGQKWEIQADGVVILGEAPDSFPLQKKRHSDEFLRTIAHLRPRTSKYGAIFRIRSELTWAVHRFFRDRNFFQVHTPVITGSDCEGAGELFRVTKLNPAGKPAGAAAPIDSDDFFGRKTSLTVSGQLSAEMLALALGHVYTFGPAFRAENSNTSRHMAEFWMLEPEMAFCDLGCNMDLAEELIRHLVRHAMEASAEDLALFARFVDKGLMKTLNTLAEGAFVRLSYTEAVGMLQKAKADFVYPVEWGVDLRSEHERYLADTCFQRPVILYDYPADIKPFYMRVNDDGKTVAAMDVLAPGIGEIIGGSQREERLDVLERRMTETGMSREEYWWYLDSRRFGTVPHSGFGMGFERMLMLVTGIRNIRDVLPFPRTPGSIDF